MRIDAASAAVVTGAASGLGEAVASALAEAGARVAVFDRDAVAGRAVAKRIGGVSCTVDVADADAVQAALATARQAHGTESITVNCAGIVPAARTVSRGRAHDAALFHQVIAINLIGTFNVASQSAAGMVQRTLVEEQEERGVIINTASVAAMDGQIGQVAYAASKGGVAGMTLPMARDLADKRVRVIAVAPGIFGTPMVSAFPETVQASLAAQVPHPARLGRPEEFAALVRHIVENAYLNGEVVRLDGAVRMSPR